MSIRSQESESESESEQHNHYSAPLLVNMLFMYKSFGLATIGCSDLTDRLVLKRASMRLTSSREINAAAR